MGGGNVGHFQYRTEKWGAVLGKLSLGNFPKREFVGEVSTR